MSGRLPLSLSRLVRVAALTLGLLTFPLTGLDTASACLEGGQSCSALTDCCAGCSGVFSGTCNTCRASKQSCTGLGRGTCCNGLTCDFLGECRHTPGTSGELCGAGVPCAASLSCVGGRCAPCRTGTQSCTGLGQGTCCNDLLCDLSGKCRHVPGELDEPCGAGVPCGEGLSCSAAIGGTCEPCGEGTDSCIGLGQGSCCDDLLCDVSGKCRHVPGELNEPCGAGVPCAEDLSCSGIVGGVCESCGVSGSACFGLGLGTCCSDSGDASNPYVCDFTGECRHGRPTEGEPCGLGVPCSADLVCNALAGGRCVEYQPAACDRLFPDCPDGKVCDFVCGECRDAQPTEGEVCGLDDFFGPDCSDGMTCRLSLPCSRCEAEKGLGQRCFSSTNCEENLQCWPFEQKCFPEGGENLFPPEVCSAIYAPETHLRARQLGVALAVSTASVAGVGISGTIELGGVYGPDGRYGCFVTRCTGGEISVGISSSACIGLYNDYESFIGLSTEIVESVGPGTGVQFSTSQILNTDGMLIGTSDCFSLEASVSPVLTVGAYACDTIVQTFFGALTTGEPSGLAGDSNGDGEVVASDALVALKSAVSNETRCPRCVCDLNGSGKITATDALFTLKIAVGESVEALNPDCQTPPLPTTTTTMEPDPVGVSIPELDSDSTLARLYERLRNAPPPAMPGDD